MADYDYKIGVKGAFESAASMERKATYIRVALPMLVRRIGNLGQQQARAYSRRAMRTRGANPFGERTGNLIRAIQADEPQKTASGWTVTITTRHLADPLPDPIGRVRQPEEYVGFVEEGTSMKVIKRGNLMVFPESRPGFPFGFWASHVFRGQRGKHMYRDAARDINRRFAPREIRDFGRRIGNL